MLPLAATKTVYTIWKQIVKLTPAQIVLEAAKETKTLSRTFTPWSHLLALIYQQLTRTESLNGVCDAAAVPGLRVVQIQGLPLALQGAGHARPRLLHDTADAQLLRLGR